MMYPTPVGVMWLLLQRGGGGGERKTLNHKLIQQSTFTQHANPPKPLG